VLAVLTRAGGVFQVLVPIFSIPAMIGFNLLFMLVSAQGQGNEAASGDSDWDTHAATASLAKRFTVVPASVQELSKQFVGHLEVPFGCGVNTDDMPEDAPSRNLAALWLRAAFHDVGKYDPAAPDQMVSGLLAQPDFLKQTENAGMYLLVSFSTH
jgi:hypothetical protein